MSGTAVSTATLARLAGVLQREGRASGGGNGWLSGLAILALTVGTWLFLIVIGGTLMFRARAEAGVYVDMPGG